MRKKQKKVELLETDSFTFTALAPAGLETRDTADLEVCAAVNSYSGQKCYSSLLSIFLLVLGLSFAFSSKAQIQQAWVAHYNNGITNGTNQAIRMTLDSAGNIYIIGSSQNSNSQLGYVTIKYAPNGNQLWATRLDSTIYPTATPAALVLDSSNDVIVTGSAGTAKYDPNGNQLWTAPYSGTALAVDTNGNVGVTGFGTSFNTVKLSFSGSNLWTQTFPPYCNSAVGQAIVSDINNDFYVAGNYAYTCSENLVSYELLIIKYDSNGNQIWINSNRVEPDPPVQVVGLAGDSSNNIYVMANFLRGSPGAAFGTFKCSISGVTLWAAFPDNGTGPANGMAIDGNSNALLAGQDAYQYSGSFSYYCSMFKLNPGGSGVWDVRFPQPPSGSSAATSIVVDSLNNSYVTGYSPGTNSLNDIVTIKYGPNGNQVWLQRYNGPGNGNDAGNAISVDNNGNVYVTGYDTTAAGGTEIVTIKYSPLVLQKRADGSVLLQARGYAGESFDIQASADLLNWLDLGIVTADTNGLMQFDDTNAPNYPSRFYYTNPQ